MINGVQRGERVIGSGTLLGSPLSPILFTICLAETLQEDTLNYIDDCADVREWRAGVVEEIVKEKGKKLKEVGMKLDETKTKAYIFRREWKNKKEEALEGTRKKIAYLGIRMDEKLEWKDYIEYRLQMGEMRLEKTRNQCKKKGLRWKYARIVVWNTAMEAIPYGSEIWSKEKKKGIEEKYKTFFKKYARVIIGFPMGSKRNMAILEADIMTAQAVRDKSKRRFVTRLLAAGYLDNTSEQQEGEKTMEKIFQSVN